MTSSCASGEEDNKNGVRLESSRDVARLSLRLFVLFNNLMRAG